MSLQAQVVRDFLNNMEFEISRNVLWKNVDDVELDAASMLLLLSVCFVFFSFCILCKFFVIFLLLFF